MKDERNYQFYPLSPEGVTEGVKVCINKSNTAATKAPFDVIAA